MAIDAIPMPKMTVSSITKLLTEQEAVRVHSAN